VRTRKILLLDTASLYFRAFYGVPDSLRSPDGLPVNAVRGLLDFIARLVDVYSPTHVACCWDNDWRPAWRVALLPSYKAHRVAGSPDVPAGSTSTIKEMSSSEDTKGESAPDDLAVQVPWIRETLRALGIRVVGKDGYEADDVIGTLAATLPLPVDVVTGDRDLFQVVDDAREVRVLYIARGVGKHEQVDDAWVRERYGVPAAAYVDFATMRGDASDGLPGVAGIGDKTAASLIASYGDLDGILAAASEPGTRISASVRAKLHAAIDYLAVAPEVVRVARDLDLGVGLDDLALPAGPAEPELFEALTERLGLGTSATRVLAALAR
jgi:5'-3' exonuclease